MTADRVHGKRVAGAARPRAVRKGVEVSDEQRQHLVDACAFFRADRFRDAEPGCCRAEDMQAAAADIDAVIAPRAGRTRKRRG